MNILLSAYSCSPSGGSEEAVGWNWAVAAAARGHRVTVLTPTGSEAEVLAAPRPDGLDFLFVPEPRGADLVRGQAHWYVRYLRWQWAARRVAERVVAERAVAERPIDVVHHLTWASLQLGTFLGGLGPPLVFGPAGGGQTAPAALRPYYHGRWAAEQLRTFVTTVAIRLDPFAVLAMRRAAVAVADNDETADLMRALGARVVHQQSQCGIREDDLRAPDPGRRDEPVMTLLWVGRMMARKALPLALEAMRRVPADVAVRLRVIGYGPQEDLVAGWIAAAGLEGRVDVVGRVPYEQMVQEYRTGHALLFTSVRDSGGIQLVEAMGQGLPCIVLDHHGARLLVTDGAGIRVPIADADGTAAGLAAAITGLAQDRDLWWRLAEGAHRRAQEHTWDRLVATFEETLGSAVRTQPPG